MAFIFIGHICGREIKFWREFQAFNQKHACGVFRLCGQVHSVIAEIVDDTIDRRHRSSKENCRPGLAFRCLNGRLSTLNRLCLKRFYTQVFGVI